MKQTLLSRELITLDELGVSLRGTYHKPSITRDDSSVLLESSGRVGLLFLNSFSTPRAWFGDTAVQWAEAFAAYGYPSFRFDLPGLGDSGGGTPKDLFETINSGGYASIACSKTKELIQRFNLSGVVLVGHCAGATTALFAASELKECKGLILMEPYFHLPTRLRAKVPVMLVDWTKRNRAGRILGAMRDGIRAIHRRLRKNLPPGNANLALLARWKRASSRSLPILILQATRWEQRPGQFDYLKHLLEVAGRGAQVVIKTINDPDHCFSNEVGRIAVRQHIESWLSTYFPNSDDAHKSFIGTVPMSSADERRDLSTRCFPA